MPMKTEHGNEMGRTGAYESPGVVSLRVLSGVARAAPLLGRVVAGRYHVDGVLGRGTTSMVFKASPVAGGPPVALKVLSPVTSELADPRIADRFRFEAHALSDVHHPNVVSMIDSGATEDGLLYTAMELLEGETLGARLTAQERLEPDEAARIAFDVAEGLHALHERRLLHRDVKPANVFLARTAEGGEVVKLMDLGLARTLGSDTAPEMILGSPRRGMNESEAANDGPRRRMNTEEGLVLGTGPYMSPELIEGRALDARSDIYALGVVTYRMLTGTLPFRGSDLPDVLSQHVSDPVEPPSERAPSAGLSKALDAVLLRALEKDPERRPATARDFADELRAALRESSGALAADVVTPPPAPYPARCSSDQRRKCWRLGVASRDGARPPSWVSPRSSPDTPLPCAPGTWPPFAIRRPRWRYSNRTPRRRRPRSRPSFRQSPRPGSSRSAPPSSSTRRASPRGAHRRHAPSKLPHRQRSERPQSGTGEPRSTISRCRCGGRAIRGSGTIRSARRHAEPLQFTTPVAPPSTL
jgi:serine/threonine protein kinase